MACKVCTIMASMCISKHTRLRPPSAYLQTRSITASNCISQLRSSRPPGVSPNSVNCSLKDCTILAPKCISKSAWSPSRSASLSLLHHHLHVYLQMCSIAASKCISKLPRSRPRCVSLSSRDRHFQAHLELLSSTACSPSTSTMCRWEAIYIHR